MPPETDRNARYRERRRRQRRRQIRIRRTVALAALLALGAGIALGARAVGNGHRSASNRSRPRSKPHERRAPAATVPFEPRGVHVTMSLASIPGKFDQYLVLPGLNAVELDVKDENGRIAFVPPGVPLARRTGAAGRYYSPERAARRAHDHGVYLIGRVVTFEDPVLSAKRPDLAIHSSDGSLWHNNAGLGWTNPYDRRVWRYNVDVAAAVAQAGFDEIQFDYVRFPSDGDLSLIRYPGTHSQAMNWTIAAFVHYAVRRLHPLGARVSVDVFGLSATRDLGIGQLPRRVSRYADAVYPMVTPRTSTPANTGFPSRTMRPGPSSLARWRTSGGRSRAARHA